MKFTAAAAVLSLAASTLAFPLYERALEFDDEYSLAAREIEFQDYLDARFDDFMEYLEARTGPFKTDLTKAQKKEGHAFIDGAKKGGQIGTAAAPGNSQKTVHTKGSFHLDRQQPTNAGGSHKVAVQMTGQKRKGDSSTVAQVNIKPFGKGKQPADAQVAAKLKHSLNTGKEQTVSPTKKAGRIAANQAAQQAKKTRVAEKQKTGNARAAAGQFKKGNKGSAAGTYPAAKPIRNSGTNPGAGKGKGKVGKK
ncbi:hypothetical protein BKA70DRAFT_114736 [Coprinopsis sp. MPI-PUGE-AT-0042]|nr:hypothetical protein BKA70DRAFT_114736 [Coprinopsis sp. MPI-PUGE-AT-0042]